MSNKSVVLFKQSGERRRLDIRRPGGAAGFSGVESRRAFYRMLADTAKFNGMGERESLFRTAAENLTDDSARKFADLEKRARSGDNAAMETLRATSIEIINNIIYASGVWASHMKQVVLGDSDRPEYTVHSDQTLRVVTVGESRGVHKAQPITSRGPIVPVPLHMLSTDEYEYAPVDLYNGNQRAAALENIDLGRDMADKRETIVRNLLISNLCIKSFVTTGDDYSRTFALRGTINASNIPTTNVLDSGSNSTSTKFRLASINAILQYALRWGSAFGAPFEVKAIHIPSKDAAGWFEQVTVNSNSNAISDQIMTGPVMTLEYGGMKVPMIADPTLAPMGVGDTDGYAYAIFRVRGGEEGIGRFYTKPKLDQRIVDTSRAKNNLESVLMMSPYGIVVPEPHIIFIAQIKY